MTSELKPCPFCGGEAHMSASSDGYGVECWNRRCIDMQMEQIPTEAEAIAAWNTRHAETCENMREKFGYKRLFVCSECGVTFDPDCEINYCPSCGRKVVDNAD